MITLNSLRSIDSKFRPSALALALALLLGAVKLPVQGQVSQYSFASSTGVYAPFSDGNVLISGSFLHEIRPLQLPQPFFFDGGYYSTVYVSTNGFITLGSTTNIHTSRPISSTAAYAGAISPFGANLRSIAGGAAPRDIRWKLEGEEVIVQWRGLRRNVSNNVENISFQARLNVVNGQIRFVYGSVSNLSSNTAIFPEVGLRGPNTSTDNWINRAVDTGAQTWANSAAGTTPTQNMRFTSSAPAKSPSAGLTYTWTPYCQPIYVNSATVISDCANGQFFVQVDISDIGTAPSVSISTSVGGIIHDQVGAGSYTCGPFWATGPVTLSLVHNGSALCSGSIGTFTARPCATNGTCIATPLAIPNNGCATNNNLEVEIPLSGLPELGTTVDQVLLRSVDLVLAHTSRSQLRISLRSPSGQQRDLIDRRAGFGNNFGDPAICPANFFSLGDDGDPLTNLQGNATSNISGIFAPEQSLAGFTGNPNGVWTLIICDAHATDLGALHYVRLNFTEVPCRKTQLVDDVLQPTHSCGLTNVMLDGSQTIWAEEIPSATAYKFRFFEPFSGTDTMIISQSPMLTLQEWPVLPLHYGKMYAVTVSCSIDNGLTYCDPGTECVISTATVPSPTQRSMQVASTPEEGLLLWPVPNNGALVDLVANGFALAETIASLEIHTLDGLLVFSETVPVNAGSIRWALEPSPRLATGMYMVDLRCGPEHRMQRLMVE